MRVALVSPYDLDVPGGVQAHVLELAGALRASGDEVVVIGPGGSGPDRVGVGRASKVRFNGSVAPLALDPRAIRRVGDALSTFQPDVVHVHEPMVPWVGPAAVLRGPRPVVATVHAWSDHDRLYRLARPAVQRLIRRVDAWTAVSDAAAQYHAAALGLPRGRFRIVPNGVHVDRFAQAQPFREQVDPDRPLILFVGRLEPRKGLDVLVRAFVGLKAHHPRARLAIVGDGDERDRCQSLVPAGLRPDVTFLGRVPADDLPRWFATADLFVAPARGGESFGIVLIEAMAAGATVVASDIPGYRSVATHDRTACLVPPGDHAALATALGDLVANAGRRSSLAAAAREQVRQYDWEVLATQVREVYGGAVLREHARRHG